MTHMNPGMLSQVAIAITLVLLGFGFRKPLAEGLPTWAVLAFYAAWFPISKLHFAIDGGWRANGTVLLLGAAAVLASIRAGREMKSFPLFAVSLFLVSLYILLRQLLALDPVLVIGDPVYDASIILGTAGAAFLRGAPAQIAGISWSLIAGEALFHLYRAPGQPFIWGDGDWRDTWWLSVVLARTASELVLYAARTVRQGASAGFGLRRGWRRK